MTDQLDLFPNPTEPIEQPIEREDWIRQVAQAGVRRNNPGGTSESLLGDTAEPEDPRTQNPDLDQLGRGDDVTADKATREANIKQLRELQLGLMATRGTRY